MKSFNLLFPGRHHLLTNFQMQELTKICSKNICGLKDIDGKKLEIDGKIINIIWAVTSSNHFYTRRNPLPNNRREVAIDEFAQELDANSYVYMIDDIGLNWGFAKYVLKKIEVESDGKFMLNPENTIVGCSTPEVISMYEQLGFKILPFELENRKKNKYRAKTPWELVNHIVECGLEGKNRQEDDFYLENVHRATRKLYAKYDIGDFIIKIHSDPLLGDDGDITETRDYNTYVRSFDKGAERKYNIIKDYVTAGKIVDIGCCTGSLIRQITLDDRFRESDFYGIEVARSLYKECLDRKEKKYFANDNVFFYQRNVATSKIFPEHFVNTFTTFALTHEIYSYQGEKTLGSFIGLIYEQLNIGGRWINSDVVGPENGDQEILMKLNNNNGKNVGWDKKFSSNNSEIVEYLESLSTYARFLRFAQDFRKEEGYKIKYNIKKIGGEEFLILKLKDACEFMSKKDYTDNWMSEMHETFCFWSFKDWKKILQKFGFKLNVDSYSYSNPWLIENRYKGKVELFKIDKKGNLKTIDYPVSNVLLIAEK